MPSPICASATQKEFFSALSKIDHLVLAVKDRTMGEPVSVNMHGTFQLVDKEWVKDSGPVNETMLAYSGLERRFESTTRGEPLVHLHVDWSRVRYVCIAERPPILTGEDKEIVLCETESLASRLIWFYFSDWTTVEPMTHYGRDAFVPLNAPAMV